MGDALYFCFVQYQLWKLCIWKPLDLKVQNLEPNPFKSEGLWVWPLDAARWKKAAQVMKWDLNVGQCSRLGGF